MPVIPDSYNVVSHVVAIHDLIELVTTLKNDNRIILSITPVTLARKTSRSNELTVTEYLVVSRD